MMFFSLPSCRTLHRHPVGGKPTRFLIFFVGIVDSEAIPGFKGENPAECLSQVLLWDQQGDDP
jgi:hypothetical protein